MKKVVITGITGQDGIFLTNRIMKSTDQYEIYGTTRDTAKAKPFFAKLETLGAKDFEKVNLDKVDLSNKLEVGHYLKHINPDFIYNLTGPSSVYESIKKPDETSLEINKIFNNISESLIEEGIFPNFFQASSSEMFGNNGKEFQDEDSDFMPNSPYAISKLKIHKKIDTLREAYDWKIISGIMFNHESEFRSDTYLIMKIIKYAKNLVQEKEKLILGSLDYVRDWSFAGDVADSMYILNESDLNENFVIGSGEGRKISNILDIIFKEINIDWKEFVKIDNSLLRKGDPQVLVSKPKKLIKNTNWKPTLDFESLILRCFNLST